MEATRKWAYTGNWGLLERPNPWILEDGRPNVHMAVLACFSLAVEKSVYVTVRWTTKKWRQDELPVYPAWQNSPLRFLGRGCSKLR